MNILKFAVFCTLLFFALSLSSFITKAKAGDADEAIENANHDLGELEHHSLASSNSSLASSNSSLASSNSSLASSNSSLASSNSSSLNATAKNTEGGY